MVHNPGGATYFTTSDDILKMRSQYFSAIQNDAEYNPDRRPESVLHLSKARRAQGLAAAMQPACNLCLKEYESKIPPFGGIFLFICLFRKQIIDRAQNALLFCENKTKSKWRECAIAGSAGRTSR